MEKNHEAVYGRRRFFKKAITKYIYEYCNTTFSNETDAKNCEVLHHHIKPNSIKYGYIKSGQGYLRYIYITFQNGYIGQYSRY